jgi:hypothetical protein
MILGKLLALAPVVAIATTAYAQNPAPTYFERAAYVTCREAQAMQPDARRALAVYLAEHSAQFRGVTIPNDERGAQLAQLVRGGCTLAPDAYLFTVIDRAVQAEKAKLGKR